MKIWYRAVCDEHREMCDMFVNNPMCTATYLIGYSRDIEGWLRQHGDCRLRLINSDEHLDEVFEQKYLDVSRAFVEDPALFPDYIKTFGARQ